MNLQPYVGKKVRIIDDDGREYRGPVSEYFYPDDNDDGKESIVIDNYDGTLEEFNEDIIDSITIIE